MTDFAELTDPLRPELLALCYRMLGSVHDAEDQVQETLLRAWRGYDRFEGQSSLRTWLYRIATNTCLRALENRSRRPLPTGLGAPSGDPDRPLEAARAEIPWLEPFPDTLLGADPAAVVTSRSSMRLALIAALQYLPPRQRAVLILRDVLQWRAAEVAELLGVSAVAVNSLLQRAREGLHDAAPVQDEISEPDDAAQRALLDQYAAAFQAADVAGLTRLLRADAVLEMPPYPTWFAGREHIGRFLTGHVLGEPDLFRLVPVPANGQPAFAGYRRAADGSYRAHMLEVLTCTPAGIARISNFTDPQVFALTGLPQVLT
ncbi:MAG TPA: sigma-70 family RNA polymerase sigma factor [Streptosporangiaceae bacterium]|nr:sigma-70 family RNA polymerase sigma factor [Streptosporangiaceae bacterium]